MLFQGSFPFFFVFVVGCIFILSYFFLFLNFEVNEFLLADGSLGVDSVEPFFVVFFMV